MATENERVSLRLPDGHLQALDALHGHYKSKTINGTMMTVIETHMSLLDNLDIKDKQLAKLRKELADKTELLAHIKEGLEAMEILRALKL